MILSTLTSYLSYVAKQLQTAGAQIILNGASTPLLVGGIVQAQDWPQIEIQEGVLYLLFQKITPGNELKSKTQRQYIYHCQWSWILIGTDIAPSQQAMNRGDRFMTDMLIMQYLKEANYPGFCQKMDYSASSLGVVSAIPSVSAFPVSKYESIVWDDLDFMPRPDNKASGVLYNAAGVTISAYEDMAAAATLTYSQTQGAQILA